MTHFRHMLKLAIKRLQHIVMIHAESGLSNAVKVMYSQKLKLIEFT